MISLMLKIMILISDFYSRERLGSLPVTKSFTNRAAHKGFEALKAQKGEKGIKAQKGKKA